MTDKPQTAEEYIEALREREQQRPRRERLERKGRVRNKYRLLQNWRSALDEYEGPGEAELIGGYRPSGMSAPVDVNEIAGLVVRDSQGQVHHLRLYRDETVRFIEIPPDPDAKIRIDPMTPPTSDPVLLLGGPPPAVTERLDALNVQPAWESACADGQHDFELEAEDTVHERLQCTECGFSTRTLGWLGHSIPRE